MSVGSPVDAKNGTEAAQDLLSTNNPYFYQHVLFQTDRGYSPDTAKAEAFLEVLNKYEQAGDTKDIADLLNSLGPQAGKFVQDAENLQGTQYDSNGVAFAKDRADIFGVLGKALQTPGVNLGDPTQQGTLAYDLITAQGLFGSSDAGVPQTDSGFLNGISHAIDTELYGIGGQNKYGPTTGSISQSTMYDIQQYLTGKLTKNETPEQRLENMMNILGPSRTYAVLAKMTSAQLKDAGIQSSLNKLVETGQFTGADAKALALAQANQSEIDPMGAAQVESLMKGLPNDQFGAAAKAGYVEGAMTGAQQLAQDIRSGNYHGWTKDQLTRALNGMLESAADVGAGAPDGVKLQLFSQLRTMAGQFSGNESDIINALAADVLGSMSDKSQIAATLRAMGGVGADGAIDPSSPLAKFLQSALRGQAQFGLGMPFSTETPSGQIPQAVTSLLNGLAGSGDTKLMAGTLDTVMQWTIHNPAQAAILAAQDTPDTGAMGYREALTNLLDKSFNQFVALDPANPNATIVRTMQPQTIADLEAMSAVEMGPPYNSKIAGDFAFVVSKHATEFAVYASTGNAPPEIKSLLNGAGNPRQAAALIYGQSMNSLFAGLYASEASARTQAKDTKYAADQQLLEARVVTDVFRGIGTTILLGSAWVTGGTDIPIGLGVKATGEKLVSIVGRIGLAGGSWGTFALDNFFGSADAQTQAHAVQVVEQGIEKADEKPTQILADLYNGWFSTISQVPGTEGDNITYGVINGSSFPGAPVIATDVQGFNDGYKPLSYYQSLTGQYPSAS
jgi:hypothetical protein